MTSFYKNFYRYFKIFIYILFIYSGLFKFIPLPIDLTLLTGAICVLILFFDAISARSKDKTNLEVSYIKFLFLFFCFWYLCTALYTTSQDFWAIKARGIFLLICSFYYPFICLKKLSIKLIFSVFLVFSFMVVMILSFLYLNDLLYLIISESDEFRSENKIPDYLTISEFLSCVYFGTFIFQKKFFYIYRILIIFLVILLGARAPLVIILLLHFFVLFLKYKWRLVNLKNIIILGTFAFFLLQIYEKWEGAKHLKFRLENLKEYKEDQSANERIIIIDKSLKLIAENPILGIGIGATGYEIDGIDENQYPHNHFIEVYLETGIIGFVLIMVFWVNIFLKFQFNYKNKISLVLTILILVMFFNFMKSNSFLDSRKMYIWIAIFLLFGLEKKHHEKIE